MGYKINLTEEQWDKMDFDPDEFGNSMREAAPKAAKVIGAIGYEVPAKSFPWVVFEFAGEKEALWFRLKYL